MESNLHGLGLSTLANGSPGRAGPPIPPDTAGARVVQERPLWRSESPAE